MIHPKNPNNKTFAKLPAEVTKALEEELAETFGEASKSGAFLCQIRVYRTELVLRAGYTKNGEIKQVNFDISKDTLPEKPEPVKSLELLVAASKELFHNYFKNENIEDYSPLWADYADTGLSYRYDGTNTSLESQADALLGEEESNDSDEAMIEGDFSEMEELEEIVDILKKNQRS